MEVKKSRKPKTGLEIDRSDPSGKNKCFLFVIFENCCQVTSISRIRSQQGLLKQESVQSTPTNQPRVELLAGRPLTSTLVRSQRSQSKIQYSVHTQSTSHKFLVCAMPYSVIHMLSSQPMTYPAHTPRIRLPIGLFV